MAHYLFNFSTGDREEAVARLRAKMWGIGDDELHRDVLALGDLALIYVATPDAGFIGRAELATAVHEWAPSEAQAYPAIRQAASCCPMSSDEIVPCRWRPSWHESIRQRRTRRCRR